MSTTATPGLAASLERLGTETAFSVLAQAKALEREGKDVIHLEIGEPDFDTPVHVTEAAYAAMRSGQTHYCPSAGIPELREAAAEYLSASRSISVRPENVLVGTGAKPFLFFTILATCNPGDEVIYPDPGFPIYESAIRWAGATPVALPLLEEREFVFSLDDLAASLSPRTKLVILNSPQNPTGGVLDHDQLGRIAEIAAHYRIPVLADEIYKSFLYEGDFASITGFPGMKDGTIILDGFSKAYAMTGWRLGYGVMPQPLAEQVARLMVNSNSCTASFTQLAGIAALQGDQTPVERMVAEFKRRRDLLVEGLNRLPGVSCRSPRGAFYAFPNIRALGLPAAQVADALLSEAGVAVLGGTAFGEYGEGYLRLSYANSEANLRRALERMEPVLRHLAAR